MRNKGLDSHSLTVKILRGVMSIKGFVLKIKPSVGKRTKIVIVFVVLLVIVLSLYEINVLSKEQKNVYWIYVQVLLDTITTEGVFWIGFKKAIQTSGLLEVLENIFIEQTGVKVSKGRCLFHHLCRKRSITNGII